MSDLLELIIILILFSDIRLNALYTDLMFPEP